VSAIQTVLDVIVQSSTVELFQLYNVPIAPVRRADVKNGEHRYQDLVGVVAFDAPKLSGVLTLSLDSTLMAAMPNVPSDARPRRDWIRELVNQLVGRIKNRLINFQVTLRIGLPTAMNGRALEVKHRSAETIAVYAFRTLKGGVMVTLEGEIEPQVLVYAGGKLPVLEGELIEF